MHKDLFKSHLSSLFYMVLPFFVVTAAQAMTPMNPCIKQVDPKAKMAQYFTDLAAHAGRSDALPNAKVAGVQFVKESPTLIWAFRELMARPDNMWANSTGPNIIDAQKKFKVNPACKKIICAADKIFGAGVGQRMLYLQARFDLNTSHLFYKNSTKFRVSELDDIIKAAHFYPDRLLPIDRSQKTTKFVRGYRLAIDADGNTAANASMEFFDVWSEAPREYRIYAVVHELAHNMSFRSFPDRGYHSPGERHQDLDITPQWMAFSGWVEEHSETRTKHSVKFVSNYAKTNSAEDFAEAVSTYLLQPHKLKKLDPNKYNFVKTYVFGGQEFIKGRCEEPSLKDQLSGEFADNYVLHDVEEVKSYASQCVAGRYRSFNPAETFTCIDHFILREILEEKYDIQSDLIPVELINPLTKRYSVHFPKVYAQVLQYARTDENFAIYDRDRPDASRLEKTLSWMDKNVWGNLDQLAETIGTFLTEVLDE